MAVSAKLREEEADRQTVLLLQGGGALGSYQAGAFEALAEHGMHPQWVVGVSIGAINASLIAGNPPETRVDKLRAFWRRITEPHTTLPVVPSIIPRPVEQTLGAAGALLFGPPGFYRPRSPLEWIGSPGPISYYDTSLLRTTLEEFVDFDRLNAGQVRLSVGAVEVSTGNMVYFDSLDTKIRPEHIMASGALPPGFPAVEIDGDFYWDGGLVSNTPLQYMMTHEPREHSLVFQVDLFPARGKPPTNLDEVSEREKDIRYSSRTRGGTTAVADQQNLRRRIKKFIEELPPELQQDPVAKELHDYACPALIDVVHLIYHPNKPQGSQKDYQFDRSTSERRWEHGVNDARLTLAAAPWTEPAAPDVGMRDFDVLGRHNHS